MKAIPNPAFTIIVSIFLFSFRYSSTSVLGQEKCVIVSSIAQATDIEHVEEVARDLLADVVSVEPGATNASNVSTLEGLYNLLANQLGTTTSASGFTQFVAAVNEISIANILSCSMSRELNVTHLISAFSVIFSQNTSLTSEEVHETRQIIGRILCAQHQEQLVQQNTSMNTMSCPLRCSCPPGGINSNLMCACQFFACLDPEDHFRPIFGLSQYSHRCLAFVIDTTGSMSEEISAARTIMLNFIRAEENLNELGCYILVPFNDNGYVYNSVGPIQFATTNDPAELQAFYQAVSSLTADGGGDTPEYALDGIRQALLARRIIPNNAQPQELMVRGSQVVVITDAASKRPEIENDVIYQANSRGVCIHFFISHMNSLADGIYQRVSQQTGGTLISNFANWQLATFISESSGSPCVNPTLNSQHPHAQKRSTPANHFNFNVSVFTYLLKLSINTNIGSNAVYITRPNGSITTVVSLDNFAVFSEGQPLHGQWRVQVDSGVVQVSVTQQIALDVVIYYVPANSSEVTLTPPPPCTSGSIVVVTSKSKLISLPELILNLDNGTHIELRLYKCNNSILLSDALIFPPTIITYKLVGYDENDVYIEYTIEEPVVLHNQDRCPSPSYGVCLHDEESPSCVCQASSFGDDNNCTDDNECQRRVCDLRNSDCVNANGSLYCNCHPGYGDDGISCTDINECEVNHNPCVGDNTLCINTNGSFYCDCRIGYTGDGYHCTDIDECQMNSCEDINNTYCINTNGSYSCECYPGYVRNGIQCTDMNECELNPCNGNNTVCVNTDGSFSCTCQSGYTGDGQNCTDINECKVNHNSCVGDNTLCINTNGSFYCDCHNGYTGDGYHCTDIDECQMNPCEGVNNTYCVNTDGSYSCECYPGYVRNGIQCTDINECSDKLSPCLTNAICENTPGNFTCTCPKGYGGDGLMTPCLSVENKLPVATIGSTLAMVLIIIIIGALAAVVCYVRRSGVKKRYNIYPEKNNFNISTQLAMNVVTNDVVTYNN